jgi:thymidine kinase
MRIVRARSKTIGGSLKMAKLYFKYGAMGSSKTANALITKFNYEERGMRVLLIKPAMETRDGEDVIVSRIGLSAKCRPVLDSENIFDLYKNEIPPVDVIIADESQFFTPEQIDQLRRIVDECDIPVLCFGLRTDFLTKLFPGSMRLLEIADSIAEIKTICSCGSKATVNARISEDGRVVTAGDQVCLGGNDLYVAMCHRCWKKRIAENK